MPWASVMGRGLQATDNGPTTKGKGQPTSLNSQTLSTVPVQSPIENRKSPIAVSLLTGGSDRPYVFGLASALLAKGVSLDLIGSDELDFREFQDKPGLNFLNVYGGPQPGAGPIGKAFRILRSYANLVRYATTAKREIFHILWNNKFEYFDRTALMLYYRVLGKKIVLTAHNVNARKRDSRDSLLNRLTLGIQYKVAHHVFVHTEKMKTELVEEFGVRHAKVSVIPLGINDHAPRTGLTPAAARRRLGIADGEKTILFFGRFTPYKGLEVLIAAFRKIAVPGNRYRLIIAGSQDRHVSYWRGIENSIREDVQSGRMLIRAERIPDEETEVYFKAADVVALPYRAIYQSGVLCTAYSFGLPVVAADVGSLKDDVVEGETGFVFKPEDADDLARTIERYFESDVYRNLNKRRTAIREFAAQRHSWNVVSDITVNIYASLLESGSQRQEARDERQGIRDKRREPRDTRLAS